MTAVIADAEARGATAEPAVTRRIRRHRGRLLFRLSCAWAAVVVLCALSANLLPIPGYDAPVAAVASPPFTHWPEFLGYDIIGRSVVSRLIYGAQVSLVVSVLAAVIGLSVGTVLGLAAAYFRGPTAGVISLVSDSILAFPVLVLLLAVAAVIRPSEWTLSVLLGIVSVPACQRIARANASSQLSRDYVLAARALGVPPWRLLRREVLPNIVQPLLAFAFLLVAFFMVFEGALDYLGVGVPPPRPSWGAMIAAGIPQLDSTPYIVFVPTVMLLLTVFAFNTIADGLRARFDEQGSKL